MDKVLIIGNLLKIGGAEKLMFELANFCKKNEIKPTILILDNFQTEYYDPFYKTLEIKVVRVRIEKIKNFRAPMRMIKSLYWKFFLHLFATFFYKSVHVIGLYNAEKIIKNVKHDHRFFWHVNNKIQFSDQTLPYNDRIFGNANDTIVCINKHQIEEITTQYNQIPLRSKIILFKLFVNG